MICTMDVGTIILFVVLILVWNCFQECRSVTCTMDVVIIDLHMICMIEKLITLKQFQECRLVTCTRGVVTIDLHMICMIEKLITIKLFPGMSFGDLYHGCCYY